MTNPTDRSPLGKRLAEIQEAIHGVKGLSRVALESVRAADDPTPAQTLALAGTRTALRSLRTERNMVIDALRSSQVNPTTNPGNRSTDIEVPTESLITPYDGPIIPPIDRGNHASFA